MPHDRARVAHAPGCGTCPVNQCRAIAALQSSSTMEEPSRRLEQWTKCTMW
jgi:hypothetical protein